MYLAVLLAHPDGKGLVVSVSGLAPLQAEVAHEVPLRLEAGRGHEGLKEGRKEGRKGGRET